ncbi:hypothetical protein [Haladaptatus sp. NG-SE-30]
MAEEDQTREETLRRTVLKAFAATGAVGTGAMSLSGSASAESTSKLLKKIDVSGTLSDTAEKSAGDAFEGGTFEGTVSITEVVVDETAEEGEQLAVSGILKGTAYGDGGQKTSVKQSFDAVPISLSQGSTGDLTTQATTCSILDLDLGPIHLDLLGLVVDLQEVNLDITAETGESKLLGNLLCAVAGLLDPSTGGSLSDLLDLLGGLLEDLLNNLLG